MQITDELREIGGLESMSRELGISEAQAAAGAEALAPAILGGFKKQAEAPAGLEAFGGLLAQLGGGGLLDNVLSREPTDVSRGNDVLGQIFGSKDVSRTVAQNAATRSGLDPALIKKMLPIVAMLVTGYMARQRGGAQLQGGSGNLGGLLGGLLGGQQAGTRPAGGGLGSMLDMNGDGNALDDILRMAGKLR
ncbi:MAG: DUF937 domain-containing protein [Vicinamibacterales bacterium]